jgi:hypothetical protein
MHRARTLVLLLSLLLAGLAALPARPASADAVVAQGYVWRLAWPFEHSFDGTLTIDVGPVKNGVLQSVDASSTTTVPCQRVGSVGLTGGMAKFNGGYLRCSLDIAQALLHHHGMVAQPVEGYNRITMRTQLAATVLTLAPIVSHPDLSYQLDFGLGDSVTMRQELATWGGVALADDSFPGMFGGDLRPYGFVYECVPAGPCSAEHFAGASVLGGVVPGDRASVRTGPTSLLIGGDGATTFRGAIGDLIIDPGNFIPGQ